MNCNYCESTSAPLRVMPCYHTFCEPCLEEMDKKRQDQPFNCCKCTTPICIKNFGFSDFPLVSPSTLAPAPQENGMETESSAMCELCPYEDTRCPATVYCPECNQDLCDGCLTIHQKGKLNKNHNPVEILQKRIYLNNQTCKVHDDNLTNFFCETCAKLICQHCVLANHKKCDTSTVGESKQKIKDILSKGYDNIKQQREVVKRNMEFLEKRHEQFQKRFFAWKEEAQNQRDRIINEHRQMIEFKYESMIKEGEALINNNFNNKELDNQSINFGILDRYEEYFNLNKDKLSDDIGKYQKFFEANMVKVSDSSTGDVKEFPETDLQKLLKNKLQESTGTTPHLHRFEFVDPKHKGKTITQKVNEDFVFELKCEPHLTDVISRKLDNLGSKDLIVFYVFSENSKIVRITLNAHKPVKVCIGGGDGEVKEDALTIFFEAAQPRGNRQLTIQNAFYSVGLVCATSTNKHVFIIDKTGLFGRKNKVGGRDGRIGHVVIKDENGVDVVTTHHITSAQIAADESVSQIYIWIQSVGALMIYEMESLNLKRTVYSTECKWGFMELDETNHNIILMKKNGDMNYFNDEGTYIKQSKLPFINDFIVGFKLHNHDNTKIIRCKTKYFIIDDKDQLITENEDLEEDSCLLAFRDYKLYFFDAEKKVVYTRDLEGHSEIERRVQGPVNKCYFARSNEFLILNDGSQFQCWA